jgi:integrase
VDENGDGEEDAKALTAEELGKLLEATAPEWRLLFEFLAHTGLRVGEAFGLRWGDIKGQRLKVQRRFYRGDFAPPKSKYGKRTVPLTEGMARKLWEYRKTTQYAKDDDLVFPARDGGPLNYSNVLRRGLRPAATKAGVPWAAFHTLRHTCASNLFRNGWNAKQVQLVLGHHSPAFTLATYVHLLPEDLPTPDFLDTLTGGQQWATRATETGRDEQEGQEAVYAAVQG